MNPDMIRFAILTSKDRNEVLSCVRDTILKSGGWVVDQTLFSNMAASISFELSAGAFKTFQDTLANEGIIAGSEHLPDAGQKGDIRAIISMTFSHDEPDLRREVPPFG